MANGEDQQIVGTGDGLESGVMQGTRDKSNFGSVVGNLMKTHGIPTKVAPNKFARYMALINAKFGAKSAAQKEAVANTLTYLAIVHGCGPSVKWEEIDVEPEGCTPLKMNEIVDKIITRAYHRRFMVNFSARAERMFEDSPELQGVLIPRAVRNGLPITEAKSVIDFLDSSAGVAPSVLAYRTSSKYSAVARANKNGSSSIDKSARAASQSMHAYEDDGDNDSLGAV